MLIGIDVMIKGIEEDIAKLKKKLAEKEMALGKFQKKKRSGVKWVSPLVPGGVAKSRTLRAS